MDTETDFDETYPKRFTMMRKNFGPLNVTISGGKGGRAEMCFLTLFFSFSRNADKNIAFFR